VQKPPSVAARRRALCFSARFPGDEYDALRLTDWLAEKKHPAEQGVRTLI